jgi:2-oxo-4-hydroxy-4-carboxy--5-ureidoimidazoline (OHCU) decarboxylase
MHEPLQKLEREERTIFTNVKTKVEQSHKFNCSFITTTKIGQNENICTKMRTRLKAVDKTGFQTMSMKKH